MVVSAVPMSCEISPTLILVPWELYPPVGCLRCYWSFGGFPRNHWWPVPGLPTDVDLFSGRFSARVRGTLREVSRVRLQFNSSRRLSAKGSDTTQMQKSASQSSIDEQAADGVVSRLRGVWDNVQTLASRMKPANPAEAPRGRSFQAGTKVSANIGSVEDRDDWDDEGETFRFLTRAESPERSSGKEEASSTEMATAVHPPLPQPTIVSKSWVANVLTSKGEVAVHPPPRKAKRSTVACIGGALDGYKKLGGPAPAEVRKPSAVPSARKKNPRKTGPHFWQAEPVPSVNHAAPSSRSPSQEGQSRRKIECHLCHKEGHKKKDCPTLSDRNSKKKNRQQGVKAVFDALETERRALADAAREVRDERSSSSSSSSSPSGGSSHPDLVGLEQKPAPPADDDDSDDLQEPKGPKALDCGEVEPFTVMVPRDQLVFGEKLARKCGRMSAQSAAIGACGMAASVGACTVVGPVAVLPGIAASAVAGLSSLLCGTVAWNLVSKYDPDEQASLLLAANPIVERKLVFQPLGDAFRVGREDVDQRYSASFLEALRYFGQLRDGVITEEVPADNIFGSFWNTITLKPNTHARRVLYEREILAEMLGPRWVTSNASLGEYSARLDSAACTQFHIDVSRGFNLEQRHVFEDTKMLAKLLFMKEQQTRPPFFQPSGEGETLHQ